MRRAVLLTAGCAGALAFSACAEQQYPTELPAEFSAAVTSNNWILRGDLPGTLRWGLAAATAVNSAGQSVVYAVGGRTSTGGSLSKVQAYNVATNTWISKAPLPTPLFWSNGIGVIGGKLYISGGFRREWSLSRGLFVYDPTSNTWSRKHDMPNETRGGLSGVINGRLYVLTGCDVEESCTRFEPVVFYSYNPVTDQWATLPLPLSTCPCGRARGGVSGVIGGLFYATDGLGTLDVYDPATNQWRAGASMPSPHVGGGTAVAGKLYVIGSSQTSMYDPSTDTWASRAPIPNAQSGFAATRVTLNGRARIEVVGGSRPGNNLAYVP